VRDRAGAALVALTVAFIALGAAFAVAAPLFQAPDEAPHIDMVRHQADHPFDRPGPGLRMRGGVQSAVDQVGLRQGGPIPWPPPDATPARPAYPRFDEYPGGRDAAVSCPVGAAADPAAPPNAAGWTSCQNYHFIHPPTFYVLLAPVAALGDRFGFPAEVLLLRLVCVLLVASVVALTWLTARRVWPDARWSPLAAATVVATFAPLAAIAGAVNSDSLLILIAAATIAAAAALLRAPHPRRALLLGLATGAGLLTKEQFVALALAAGLCALAALLADRGRWVGHLVCFGVPAAVGSVWWVRNIVRFHALHQPGGEILRPSRTGDFNEANPIRYAIEHIDELIGRFWGLYGQSAVETPAGWRTVLTIGVVLLAVAWIVCRQWRRPAPASRRLALLALFPAVLLAGALQASFAVFRDNGEVRGLLGRYLYPALPVLAIAAVAAGRAVVRRLRLPARPVFAAGAVACALLALAALTRALHGLYGTTDIHLLLRRAAAVAPVASVGGWLAALAVLWAGALATALFVVLRANGRVPARLSGPSSVGISDPDYERAV
jgi:4-amino-4-deoxy-L-arabinose transferase-like glycosyltransferase